MHLLKFIAIFFLVFSSVKAQDDTGLFQLMIGSFDSREQAMSDSTYYSISLHMYPIWEEDTSAKWLYVEQALFSKQDQPYRQRVYRVTGSEDEEYKSEVYTLADDSIFIGKWKTPEYFDGYGDHDLTTREGCAVYLKKVAPDRYEGSTLDKNCVSTMRGASYASSKVVVEKGLISSWDQGFDNEDQQVWGAMNGPYIFKQSE